MHDIDSLLRLHGHPILSSGACVFRVLSPIPVSAFPTTLVTSGSIRYTSHHCPLENDLHRFKGLCEHRMYLNYSPLKFFTKKLGSHFPSSLCGVRKMYHFLEYNNLKQNIICDCMQKKTFDGFEDNT